METLNTLPLSKGDEPEDPRSQFEVGDLPDQLSNQPLDNSDSLLRNTILENSLHRIQQIEPWKKRGRFLSLRDSADPLERTKAAADVFLNYITAADAKPLFSDPNEKVRLAVANATVDYLLFGKIISDQYQGLALPNTLISSIMTDKAAAIRQVFASNLPFLFMTSPTLLSPEVIHLYLTDVSEDVRLEMSRWWWPGLGQMESAKALLQDSSARVRRAFKANPGSRYFSISPSELV